MEWINLILLTLFVNLLLAQNSSIKLLDTDFSKGRLQNVQTIRLTDAVKLHRHLCDVLLVGFLGLKEGLYKLYSDNIINRSNNRIVNKPSPCLTNITIFMTRAKYQFMVQCIKTDVLNKKLQNCLPE